MRRLLGFEWRLLRRDRGLWILLITIALLGAYAAATGASFVKERERAVATLRDDERQRGDSLQRLLERFEAGDTSVARIANSLRNPAVAGRGAVVRYSILPPGPLASLAVGQGDVQPFWAAVSTRTKQTFFVNDEIENPVHLLAGRLDIGFLILVIYPLCILALTFDVVAGERERGTLALLLSQPVDPRRVLTAKIALRAMLALGFAFALSIVAAVATGVAWSDTMALTRLAAWSGVVVLYGAFWFAVALFVNARRLSSAASAVVLLSVWLAVVVVLPAVAAAAITVTTPAPSRVVLTTRLREATDAAAQKREEALTSFLLDHPDVRPDTVAANPYVMATALQDAAEQLMAPEYARFDAALDAQRRAADRFRFLSPALIVQAALLDVSGSGEARFREYERQFDEFHATWRTYFNGRMLSRQSLSAADYSTLPVFTFVEEPLRVVATRAAPGIVLLLLLTAGLIAASRRGLRQAARST